MLATVVLDGVVLASCPFTDRFQAGQWLVFQRNVWGRRPAFQIETLDGFVLFTL